MVYRKITFLDYLFHSNIHKCNPYSMPAAFKLQPLTVDDLVGTLSQPVNDLFEPEIQPNLT